MVVYYVVENPIAEMEKLINLNMFNFQHFKITRNHHYYKQDTINLELERISSFIMIDRNIVKDDERYKSEIVSKIEELES